MKSLKIYDGIQITVHNSDTARGCYFPEDDWSIKAIGKTYEEAIKKIIPDYVDSGIYPNYAYAYTVKYTIYNNKIIILEEMNKLQNKSIIKDIEEHPIYKKLKAEREKRIIEQKKKEEEERKKKKEEEERKLYARLKQKYG